MRSASGSTSNRGSGGGPEALHETLAELQGILAASYDGISVTDASGRIVRANAALLNMIGIPEGELVGRDVRDLVADGVLDVSVALLVMQRRTRVTILQRLRGQRDALVTGTPVFDTDGSVSRVIVNCRDITGLRQLDLARAPQAGKGPQLESASLEAREGRDLTANSSPMRQVIDMALRVAPTDCTILIQGESGTGKEVLCDLIQQASSRARRPYVKVNCAAIPETLLESELFGYEGGAFTGARRAGKPGSFELAHNGTILLDEVSELPLNLQAKLLRAVENREVVRIGGTSPRPADTRIIALTNSDLAERTQGGAFRRDLYYRLNVIPITLPPLRLRGEDIVVLVESFLARFNACYGEDKTISDCALEALLRYSWPGNVRELKQLIERMVLTTAGPVIRATDLPETVRQRPATAGHAVTVNQILPLEQAVAEVERQMIDRALRAFGSSRKAARALGINSSTVVRKAHHYGIPWSGGTDPAPRNGAGSRWRPKSRMAV